MSSKSAEFSRAVPHDQAARTAATLVDSVTGFLYGSTIKDTERAFPMNVTLPPDLEEFVAQLLQSGKFDSAEEAVCVGLYLLQQQYDAYLAQVERLRKEIAIGIEQADRGELHDGPGVFERVRAKLRQASGEAS